MAFSPIAEGLDILHAKQEFSYDLAAVTEAWRYGTVIRSWLLDLAAAALKDDPELTDLAPYVSDSGEGRWTIQAAIDEPRLRRRRGCDFW